MKPTTREELIDYCMRRLGFPVIEINVDDEQIEDRIDDALQFYRDYHSDATFLTYVTHELTQQDIDNKYISLNDAVLFVKRIFPLNDAANRAADPLFNVNYQLRLSDYLNGNLTTGSMLDYTLSQQNISLVNMQLNGLSDKIRFNRHMNEIHLDIDWDSDVEVGYKVIIEAMVLIDPTTYPDVYDDRFLKEYATALIKQQWGMNLLKFEGMQMPGGVTFNGRQIFDDATTEIATLRERMQLENEMPPDFFCG